MLCCESFEKVITCRFLGTKLWISRGYPCISGGILDPMCGNLHYMAILFVLKVFPLQVIVILYWWRYIIESLIDCKCYLHSVLYTILHSFNSL